MKISEQENCTFEPEAGCLNRNWAKAQAGAKESHMTQEAVPGEFFDRLGENFCKSEPAIYKRGKLKKAKLCYRQGDFDKCFNTLCEGFHLCQLYQHQKPKEFKVWMTYDGGDTWLEKEKHASDDNKAM